MTVSPKEVDAAYRAASEHMGILARPSVSDIRMILSAAERVRPLVIPPPQSRSLFDGFLRLRHWLQKAWISPDEVAITLHVPTDGDLFKLHAAVFAEPELVGLSPFPGLARGVHDNPYRDRHGRLIYHLTICGLPVDILSAQRIVERPPWGGWER